MVFHESRSLVAFDLETTGLRAEVHRIVEIGAIRFDQSGREQGIFQSLVNPGCAVPEPARAIHGLGDEELSDAPPASKVLGWFLDWLGPPENVILLAHNACFDVGFLACELARAGLCEPGYEVIDTLPLARRFLPSVPNHRLGTLAERFGFDCRETHRAVADSRRVMQLWLYLKNQCTGQPDPMQFEHQLVRLRLPTSGNSFETGLPVGCEWVQTAISTGSVVRLIYEGGTKGDQPREITPIRWTRRGGTVYLTAICHLDGIEKEFRLERIRHPELVAAACRPVAGEPVTV